MVREIKALGGEEDAPLTTAGLAVRPQFRLSGAIVRPDLRTVEGAQGSVTIEPRAMQVLLVLADAAGAVVTRDTLERRCWGGVFVSDDSINRAVAIVRRAGRESGAGFEIETIPRTGYRLLADRDGEVGSVTSPDHVAAARPSGASLSRRNILASTAGLVTLGVAGGIALRDRDSARNAVETLIARSDQAMRLATPENDRQAVAVLTEAVTAFPDNAKAWGRLAFSLRSASEFVPPEKLQSMHSQVRRAAARALALDAVQPDALAALALLTPPFGNWTKLDRELSAILNHSPDHAPSLDARAFTWAGAGLVHGHYPLRKRSVALEPLNAAYNFRLIYSHWMNGNVPAADRTAAQALELWPTHVAVWLARLTLMGFSGRPERALAILDQGGVSPDVPPSLLDLFRGAFSAMASGRLADIEAMAIRTLASVQQAGPVMAVQASLILAALGEPERSFDVVTAYMVERGPVMASIAWKPGQLRHMDIRRRLTNYLFLPPMASVRALPGFLPLMGDIGLRDFWEASGRKPDLS